MATCSWSMRVVYMLKLRDSKHNFRREAHFLPSSSSLIKNIYAIWLELFFQPIRIEYFTIYTNQMLNEISKMNNCSGPWRILIWKPCRHCGIRFQTEAAEIALSDRGADAWRSLPAMLLSWKTTSESVCGFNAFVWCKLIMKIVYIIFKSTRAPRRTVNYIKKWG